MNRGSHDTLFAKLIDFKNLLVAWREFKRGKGSKTDIREFEFNLEDNIFQLHTRLKQKTWASDPYTSFYVRDPKLRHIHKATVRDRVFNQALFRLLYPLFDKSFIHDSYSCRIEKGTHRGVRRLDSFIRSITQNHTRGAFALKCDVKKFFDNISHDILFELVARKVKDPDVLSLIKLVIQSFETSPGKGLPLGNVTSQLFANVYLNELDQFVKHVFKERYYVRYCDDFIILGRDKDKLSALIPILDAFFHEKLELFLHPQKIILRKVHQGIDFLGYVILPHYRVLRTRTKRRTFKKIKKLRDDCTQGLIKKEALDASINSYCGMLNHCKGYQIQKRIYELAGQS